MKFRLGSSSISIRYYVLLCYIIGKKGHVIYVVV